MDSIYVNYDTLGDTLYVNLYVDVQEDELPKRHRSREIDF